MVNHFSATLKIGINAHFLNTLFKGKAFLMEHIYSSVQKQVLFLKNQPFHYFFFN